MMTWLITHLGGTHHCTTQEMDTFAMVFTTEESLVLDLTTARGKGIAMDGVCRASRES